MTDPTRGSAPGTPVFAMPSIDRVHAYYHSLFALATTHFAGCLGGRFFLVDSLDSEGDALLTAASIAGAASVVLEQRPDAVRHCVRHGIVDFAVNTLEEALRVLKNEIRKQQPLAVLLQQDPATALAAMVERGAQPDLLRWLGAAEPAVATLRARGAVDVAEDGGSTDGTYAPASEVAWSAGEGGAAALRLLDQLAMKLIPNDDRRRQNWLARAPQYLSRAMRMERGIAMEDAEVRAFLTAIEEQVRQGTIARPVTVQAAGQSYEFCPTASGADTTAP